MTDFYNLDLDTALGGSTPSDITVSSQKAIKTYVDNAVSGKQGTLTAGTGIDITNDVVSVKNPVLTNTSNESTNLGIKNAGSLGSAYQVAVGYNCQSHGSESVVIGPGSHTTNYGVSIGAYANTSSSLPNWTTCVGCYSQARSEYSIAFGCRAEATALGAIQIGAGTNSTASTFSVGIVTAVNPRVSQNYTLLTSDGTIPADRLPNSINKYSIMPTADSTNLGWIIQYIGADDAVNGYTHGYIYECVSDGAATPTYSWTQLDVQPSSGSVSVDNLTITTNSSDEIQSVATINANTATGSEPAIYDWVGTLSEYQTQAVATTHPEWICYITDDVGGGTSVYTKTEVNSGFVAKGHEVIEFQAPTSSNNYTWYRKYADGWVEQGGIADGGSSTSNWSSTVIFPVEMSDANYSYQVTPKLESFNTGGCAMGTIYQNTTTGFPIEVASKYSNAGYSRYASWRVEGMAASAS